MSIAILCYSLPPRFELKLMLCLKIQALTCVFFTQTVHHTQCFTAPPYRLEIKRHIARFSSFGIEQL